MSRTAAWLVLMLAGSLGSEAFGAQSVSPRPDLAADPRPLVTNHPILQASLRRIERGSALWREALRGVETRNGRVLLLTPDQVVVADGLGGPMSAFDPGVLAEVAPVARNDASVQVVLVVINLELLHATHRQRNAPAWEFENDLDRILIHEVYGHALPYLLAGHLSGRCADPGPRERAVDACSIQRENAVRSELGLGRRGQYGLADLALARPATR